MPRRKARRAAGLDGGGEYVPNYDPKYVPNSDPEVDAASNRGRNKGGDVEQFLRGRRRVSPRGGSRFRALARTRLGRVLLLTAVLLVLAALGACGWAIRSFLEHDGHFRIDSSASIEAEGNNELSRGELVKVFGSDIGRNVFFVPLARREAALEASPWVRHATVMRVLPNTIRVTIEERVPVAFVRVGRQIELVDGEGVLLSMTPATLAQRHYSFPVVVGLDPASPPGARAERMHLFRSFVSALDSGGGRITSQLSEVDLSDLDDVRAVVPAEGTDILLHFGDSDFLERYRSYQEHLGEWRQQYPHLSAVDLRYDRQVVLKMADAAEADETAERKPLSEPVLHAGQGARVLAKSPERKAAPAVARRSRRPATKHPNAAAGTWYTERAGAHGRVRWVAHPAAHPTAHPVPNDGRSPQ